MCERCTEIDDHLQNVTSEPERKLWLEAKRIHRKYVSMTYWWLNFMHTQPISLQICKHVAFCFLRCERRGECTTSGVPKLLLLQMPWAQSLTAQTRHSTFSLTLHRTTSPPLMGWSTRFAALNICWDENKLVSTLLLDFFFYCSVLFVFCFLV